MTIYLTLLEEDIEFLIEVETMDSFWRKSNKKMLFQEYDHNVLSTSNVIYLLYLLDKFCDQMLVISQGWFCRIK